MDDFDKIAKLALTAIPFLGSIVAIILSINWHFNRKAKKRYIEELRQVMEKLSPTDPQYNTARALYMSAIAGSSLHSSDSHSDSSHSHTDFSSHDSGHGDSGGSDSGD